MIETVVLFVLIAGCAAWLILPSFFKANIADSAVYLEKINVPEDSVLRRHFLTHLKSEIEAAHQACPTDPVLRHHYHTLAQYGLVKTQ